MNDEKLKEANRLKEAIKAREGAISNMETSFIRINTFHGGDRSYAAPSDPKMHYQISNEIMETIRAIALAHLRSEKEKAEQEFNAL